MGSVTSSNDEFGKFAAIAVSQHGSTTTTHLLTHCMGAIISARCVMRDANGSYAMVYTSVGRSFKVCMDKITGPKVKAWWFNLRNGQAEAIGIFDKQGGTRVSKGEMLDQVLVLDAAARELLTSRNSLQQLDSGVLITIGRRLVNK